MTKLEKILLGSFIGVLLIGAAISFGPKAVQAFQLYNQVDQYSYFSLNTGTTTAATVVQPTGGVFHSIVVTNPVASSVITIYDSSNGAITALTTATATIQVGPSATATSTATGTISLVINGLTITTASISNGSTTTQAATALTTAITAVTAQAGVGATSSNNIVTLTAIHSGPIGNIRLPVTAAQNGFTFVEPVTNATGTPIITQITIPASTTYLPVPITAIYDVTYKNGLAIQQTVGTSSVTLSWQQN